MNNLRRGLS